MKNHQLTITWKSMRCANRSIKPLITTKKFYDTVENQQELGNLKGIPTESFKKGKDTSIIIGQSKPSMKINIEVEKKTETFKNIKTLEKAQKLISGRNKSNIQSVTYGEEVIYTAPKEELV